MIDPVAIGLAGQTEQKEQTEFRERRVKGENKPRREQTEHDVSRGTHHVISPSRPSHPSVRMLQNFTLSLAVATKMTVEKTLS